MHDPTHNFSHDADEFVEPSPRNPVRAGRHHQLSTHLRLHEPASLHYAIPNLLFNDLEGKDAASDAILHQKAYAVKRVCLNDNIETYADLSGCHFHQHAETLILSR